MNRWLVGMTAVGLACGGDSSGPGATSVTGIAGDNQTASRGSALPVPLSFTALGSDGLPIEGVSVAWSATPSNAASFSPAAATTDANGVASATVILGTALGAITMQATLKGVPPVVYHATVTDPCTTFTPYTVGQTIEAALTTADCRVQFGSNVFYFDFYALDLPPGQQNIRITMHGVGAFDDPYLDFLTDELDAVAFDDDSILGQEGARNAQLDLITPGDTSYIIGANSFDPLETGSYTLASENRTSALNGCRAVWVIRGISVTDTIKATDCADSSTPPKYYEVARMIVFAPSVLTLRMASTALNPLLALYELNPSTYARTALTSNDDSLAGVSTNAFIRYSVNTSSFIDIIVGTSTEGETGEYTFEVSASTTLAPHLPGSAPNASSRDRWWRDVGLPKRSRR